MKKKNSKNIKICFAASTGGHFEQLMMLKPLMQKYDSFIVTEKTKYGVSKNIDKKIYNMKQVNRKELTFPINMIINTVKSIIIFIKERPDVMITTGVLAMIPLALIMKLFGKKLIYIESFAKITSPTQTGKFLYKKADKFFIQWEKLKEFYPEATYKGGIY